MNDQNDGIVGAGDGAMDPGGEYKDSHELAEEKAKGAVREMFDGLKALMDDMVKVKEKIQSAQRRHADVLSKIGKHPMQAAQSAETPVLEAILDLTASMADSQVIAMEMGHRQVKMMIEQMEQMIDL